MTKEQAQMLIDKRFDDAIEKAAEAFWGVISNEFPEITTGDLPPDLDIGFCEHQRNVVAWWITYNASSKATFDSLTHKDFISLSFHSEEN